MPRGLQDVGVGEKLYKPILPTDELHGREIEPHLVPNVVVPHYRRPKELGRDAAARHSRT